MKYKVLFILLTLALAPMVQSCNIHPACAAYASTAESKSPADEG